MNKYEKMSDEELFSLKLLEMDHNDAFEALKEIIKRRKAKESYEEWLNGMIKLHGKENVEKMLKREAAK